MIAIYCFIYIVILLPLAGLVHLCFLKRPTMALTGALLMPCPLQLTLSELGAGIGRSLANLIVDPAVLAVVISFGLLLSLILEKCEVLAGRHLAMFQLAVGFVAIAIVFIIVPDLPE